MSIVNILNKKHKVMNCVFEILYDLYGEPVWLKKPKEGQVPEKIIEQWITELGDYSETQLRQACYNLFKYKKVATFPKLAHVLAELCDQPKEISLPSTDKLGSRYMCIEQEFMQRDIQAKRCKYCFPIYKTAVERILNDLLKNAVGEGEYFSLEKTYQHDFPLLRGKKYRKSLELGLFDNFDEILEQVAKERFHG